MKKERKNDDPLEAAAIGANIRALRRQAHLTQGEFARRLGMRQGPVCNLEQGRHYPSTQVLLKMARILDVSLDRLLLPEGYLAVVPPCAANAPDGVPVIRHAVNPALYLTSRTDLATAEGAWLSAVEAVVRAYLALEDICRVPRRATIPLQLEFAETSAGMERLALQYRALLGISDAVVFDLLELFENHGLRVVFMPWSAKAASLSCYDGQNGNMFVFVKADNNPEKQIFALAYELGRVLLFNLARLHERDPFAGEPARDKLARYLAACFLMPEAVVRNSVGQTGVAADEWDLPLLLRLKHRFGVSAESFNYRLLELGLIAAPRQEELRGNIKAHYQAHAYAEPGRSRRILSPNGRLGDLLHIALQRNIPEAAAIAANLKKMKIPMP